MVSSSKLRQEAIVRYPNLAWAINERHRAHYQAAAEVGMSESRFSRCLTGRSEFSSEDRKTIAKLLDYPEDWLFRKADPPSNTAIEDRPLATVSA